VPGVQGRGGRDERVEGGLRYAQVVDVTERDVQHRHQPPVGEPPAHQVPGHHAEASVCTDVSPAGLALLAAARPTNSTALPEALDLAARDAQLAPLVKAVEEIPSPAAV
jgi:hypothetical protein